MQLTNEQKEKYLKSPGHCPHCGSTDISGGPLEADGDVWQVITCENCNAEWTDVYKLVAVENT